MGRQLGHIIWHVVRDKSLLSAWQSVVCNQAVFAEAIFAKREHPTPRLTPRVHWGAASRLTSLPSFSFYSAARKGSLGRSSPVVARKLERAILSVDQKAPFEVRQKGLLQL